MPIFTDVHYFISPSLLPQRQSDIAGLLLVNGAVEAALTDATHVVTNTNRFEGWGSIGEDVAVVTEKWVERSLVLGKIQPTQYYSANSILIFSGVVACSADLPVSDVEAISAGISALGGQFRMGLTRDVTHLFALSPGSTKYETAMHFRGHTNVKILLPHWFDDSIRLGYSALETAVYEWPNPMVLESGFTVPLLDKDKNEKDKERRTLFKGLKGPSQDMEVEGNERNVWNGRKLMLGESLQLIGRRREAVEAGIRRAGGIIVKGNVDDADVLVTRHRFGKAYLRALELGKTIGSLAWLFYVESTGVLSAPTDQFFHYPTHKRPIEGFSSHVITVTNYTGESRDYLKKMITAMGAEFTPSMSGKNTVLIAAYLSGTKATKARTWSIPIVNHTWLEDCFLAWKKLTFATEKYIVFPPGMDFSTVLGVRGVTGIEKDLEDEELARDDDEEVSRESQERATQAENIGEVATDAPKTKPREPLRPESSLRDASEVADLIDDGINADVEDAGEERPPTSKGALPTTPKRGAAAFRTTKPQSKRTPKVDKRPLKQRDAIRDRSSVDVESEDEVVPDEPPRTTVKASMKPKSASKPAVHSDAEPAKRTVKTSPVSKARPNSKAKAKEAAPNKVDREERVARPTNDRGQKKTPPKGDGFPLHLDTDTDEDFPVDVRSPPLNSNKSTGKEKLPISPPKGRKLTRVVSVLIPPAPYPVSPTKSVSSVGKDLEKMGSMRATAHEATLASPRKPQLKRARASESENENENDSFSVPARTSRRAAATKATEKLRHEVMPDVLNFQLEMKKTKGKGKTREQANGKSRENSSVRTAQSEPSHTDSEESDEKPRAGKRRRVSKGTKAKELGTELETSESELPSKRRGKRAAVPQEEEESSAESIAVTSKKTVAFAKDTASTSAHRKAGIATAAKNIRLMTTGCTLGDDVNKALVKLGVKFTTKPSDCTHLIVPKLLRTEKLLCALAVSPHILTEKWAINSAAIKAIQPEDRYLLHDEEIEKKYKFKLSESLQRAKENGGRLFHRKVFYVTPKVPVDMTLLRNVITSCGGQFSTQNVTDRVLKNNHDRHVISCPADERVWKPIAGDYAIYTQELILTGVLKQEVDWENPDFQVPGSF